METTIRTATIQDIEELQKLFVEAIQSTCVSDYDGKQINAWVTTVENPQRWHDLINDQYVLLAQDTGEIVGFASLENGNYLDFLYVHKGYLRQGIASILYQELKAESERLGHTKITSDVSKTAKLFFKRKGFKVVRENNNILDGVEIINYLMTQ